MVQALHKILWIDDEYDELENLPLEARLAGLQLVPFRSLEQGMQELADNYSSYEAVLLDAKFFAKEDDVPGTEDTQNVFLAQQQINKLAAKKELEIFVLSGYSEDPSVIDRSFHKSFSNFYRKHIPTDADQLWVDINAAVDRQPIIQLRRKYASAFAVCDDRYISPTLAPILVDLLSDHEDGRLSIDHLNAIRKVLEHLSDAIAGYGIVPSELDTLNTMARFLRGDWSSKSRQSTSYRLERDQFPEEVGRLFSSLVATTQAGSHAFYLDAHLRRLSSDYWLQASLYQLLGLLEWFKPYVDLKLPTPRFQVKQ